LKLGVKDKKRRWRAKGRKNRGLFCCTNLFYIEYLS
jgi:hypothetical protein